MDRGTWRVTVHGVRKSQTRLKRLKTHTYKIYKEFIQFNFFFKSGFKMGKGPEGAFL